MEGEGEIPPPILPDPSVLPTPSGPPSILVDTVLLIVLRIGYFYLARRYLLAQLNPALRELQKPEAGLPTHHVNARDHPHARDTHARARDRANSRASMASVKSNKSAKSATHSVRSTASGSGVAGPSSSKGLSGLPGPGGLGVGGKTSSSSPSSVQGTPRAASDSLPSDIEDTEEEPSSYPPSITGTPPARKIEISHGGATPPGRLSPTGIGGSGHQPVEMSLLGAKLRDARPRQQVLELSHARAERSTTRAGKRAARGLGRVARTLFAVCFAESMNLLTLVVFHALGILHWHTRQFNFSVSLYVLLAIILLIVPLVQCLLFTYRSREANSTSTRGSSLSFTSRLLISMLPFGLYIFAFTRIPPYITVMDDWEGGGGWLAPSLGRVVVLGILIMAALSGIGAVKTAWDYLEQAAGGGRRISDADVVQAERSLYRVRQDVVSKRDEINRLAASQPERSNGWMGGVFGSKSSQQMAAVKAELQGLQGMEAELSRSLAGMKTKQKRQGFRNSFAGSIVNMLGYVFAFYCGARLLMCLVSVFISPFATSTVDDSPAKGNTNGDWISFIIALGLSHLPFSGDLDIATWSRGISLLLTGLLILSSLTMVLRWLTRVLRMTSKTVGAGFLLLTLGQIYATYVISLLVQLRSSLPATSDEINSVVHSINDSFGNGTSISHTSESLAAAATYAANVTAASEDSLLRSFPDFRVFGRLFDSVFLVAALGTAVYRYVAMRVERTDDGAIFGVGR